MAIFQIDIVNYSKQFTVVNMKDFRLLDCLLTPWGHVLNDEHLEIAYKVYVTKHTYALSTLLESFVYFKQQCYR